MKNPVIGITLDTENNQNYSMFPWYASRKNYSDSVVLAGGTPVFLPHNLNMIEKFIEVIDGIIITGGDFDIDPEIYGEKVLSNKVSTKVDRTKFEFEITKAENMFVNSAHHQAVKTLGQNLIVNCSTEDGVIEGIEDPDAEFCIGVQWHPEFLLDKKDIEIFKSLIESSRNFER